MIALDTNMLVRALVLGNPAQVEVVRQLMAVNTVFISRTVLLETEWVLRSRYKKAKDQLHAFFVALLASGENRGQTTVFWKKKRLHRRHNRERLARHQYVAGVGGQMACLPPGGVPLLG